jgi:hypothetical protein
MALSDYLPTKDAELDEWADNYLTQLALLGAALGVAPGEMAAINTKVAAYKTSLNTVTTKDAEKRNAVGLKNMAKSELITLVRPLNQRLKNTPGYTDENQGQLLRIVGPDQVPDPATMLPVLKEGHDAGRPKIIWQKGLADALSIYVDRRDGQGYRFLATDSQPDYVDTFPVPPGTDSVVWDYKAIYVLDEEEAGQWSEPVSITVTNETT